jgi:hypothetical protein
MASQVERVFYGSNQVPGQQLSREDIKQLRFRIKRDDGTIDNVVFDPLVGQDLYMACLKFFKNYSHGSNPTEVGHYEVGEAGANGNDFNVEINNLEIFLFREDDLVLTDGEFDRLLADLVGWTPVALRSTSSDNVQHQWLYLSRSPDTGIRFICIEDTKARIAVIAPDSPHNIAISDAFDTSLFELKSNKTSYIDPTINQSGKYLGGSAVNGFVEKRTFAISIPYGTTNTNTFTKILEFNETFDGSRTRGAIFARLKIQFVGTSIKHRLREIDAYIGYELNGQKAFVTFGNCYNTLVDNDLKKLHIVTYDTAARRHIEVYLEHRELTAMTNWISVEVCENFEILENSWTSTQTSHSPWKIPLANYDWDEMNGASVQPTVAALPTTGVLKTDSYIVQSGNQVPFTYVPSDDTSNDMAIAKLIGNPSDTRLVFKLYSSEGWVAIGKVERANDDFTLRFSAIADSADFEAGVAVPYIYLSNLDGVYYVNLKIDSYHTVLESIAIEVENVKKDWEFFGSIPPDSVGTTAIYTDTYMKADPTAEVIDQGRNVPAPTSSTKVLTKQVDANGREFWATEQMSDIPVDAQGLKVVEIGSEAIDLDSLTGGNAVKCYFWSNDNVSNISHVPFNDAGWLIVYPQSGASYARQVAYRRGTDEVYTRHYSGAVFTSWVSIALENGTYPGMTVGNVINIVRGSGSVAVVSKPLTEVWDENNRGLFKLQYAVADYFGEYFIEIQCKGTITSSNPLGDDGFVKVYSNFTQNIGSNIVKYAMVGNNVVFGFSPSGSNRYMRLEVCGHGVSAAAIKALSDYSFTAISATDTFWSVKSKSNDAPVGGPVNPVYVTSDGSVAACNLKLKNVLSDVTLSALGAGEDAWVRVRNAGSSSITVIAGTLNRTLSPSQACDVYGYNGSYVQIS